MLVALLMATLATPASARRRSTMLIVELEARGLDPTLVDLLDAEMRREVGIVLGRKVTLLPKPALDFEGMRLAAGCVDDGPKCLLTIGKTLGAARVMRVVVAGTAERASLRLVHTDIKSGRSRTTTAEMTDIDAASTSEFRVHVAFALGVKRAAPPGGIELYTASEVGKLDGADIFLDDQRVQRPDLTKVPSGKHRLEVRQKGFETFVWMGAVRPGRRTSVGVIFKPTELVAAPPTASQDTPAIPGVPGTRTRPRRSRATKTPATQVADAAPPAADDDSRVVTWILTGGAVAAGAVALAFGLEVQERESELIAVQELIATNCMNEECGVTVCDTPVPHPACAEGRRAALVSNVAMASASALLVGAVVAFFAEAPDETPAVSGLLAPTKDGATAAVSVRF